MNKKIIYISVIAVAILAFFLSNISLTGLMVADEPVIIAYCPTMTEIAEELQSKNEFIVLKEVSSSSEAFNYLNRNAVNAVLVGRVAKKIELQNPFELRLREGATLVGSQRRFMLENELETSRIHTSLKPEDAERYFLNNENIVFYETTEEAINMGLNDVVLIDWKDYTDDLELVTPVDINMNKVKSFRIPVLYSFNEELIENLDY